MAKPVDLDRRKLDRQRAKMTDLEIKQTRVRADLAARQAQLDALQRSGASDTAIQRAADRVAKLERSRDDLHDRHADIVGRIGELGVDLADGRRPDSLVTALDADLPVAMLPVRIETRFSPDRAALDIRIYPDQVHLDNHEPEFTDAELEGSQWYWQQRWPDLDDAAVADDAFGKLATRFRPGRARYLVDTMRPGNLAAAPGADPVFPDVARRASSWTRAMRARALPPRWVAVGYQDETEVFRVWSSHTRAVLDVGPTPAAEEKPPPLPPDATMPHVQDGMRWAVDLQAARDAGMALTVKNSQLRQGATLAEGLTRLVVVGVDWESTPEQSATNLDALLAGHAAVGDLAFVAPGTPTNNTGTTRSGFSTAPSDQVAEWAPPVAGDDPDIAVDRSAGRLAAALGITAATLAVAPGAGGHHHRTASALVDALWEASGGYFATDMLDPVGSDVLTMRLRAHAASHLHPAGPLPTIRIGPQPYGVLPVVAPRYVPTAGDRAEQAISYVGSAVRSQWIPLIPRVPHLGRPGEQRGVDEMMLDLLQRTPVPWSMRWREMIPPPQWSSTDWMTTYRTYQAPYLFTILTMLGITNLGAAKVQYLTQTKDSHRLTVPLVLKGDEGTAYLAEIAGLASAGAAGRRDLNLRQNSIALLEALLAFAATQEMDKAATGELVVDLSVNDQTAQGFVKLGVRTPDLVRVDAPPTDAKPLQFATARELAATAVPGTNVAVHDAVADRLDATPISELIDDVVSPAHSIARFLAALTVLSSAPADEIEWAFRGVLDLYSTRLDAWLTSLASSRLARQREARPTGVHLGCYGWVEDLHPDSGAAAESLGHVVAPSLSHAVAAAVLRSGRQAHSGSGAFDLDLSSRRVREAMAMLEGVASGQSIAALVGYRIERRLRDAGLADLTVPLRIEAPLQSRDSQRDEPVESIAARDVVDGVKLLTVFANAGPTWEQIITRINAGARRARLEAVLHDVAANYDAVTDVLFAETLHQTAVGNLDRAGAAASALDRQERPIDPDVIHTPRSGAIVANRVVVTLRSSTPAADWPARGPRGAAEPRLDGWLGSVLGPPDELSVRGRLVRPSDVAGDPDTVTDLGVVTAADLELSPLALVLTAQRPSAGGVTELDHRITAVLRGRVADLTGTDKVECDDVSLLHTVTNWAAQLVGGCRPLAPTDLTLAEAAGTVLAGSVDIDDLTARVSAAVDAVDAARTILGNATQTAAGLRGALLDVAELIGGEALPSALAGDPTEVESLSAQVADMAALLDARSAAITDLSERALGTDDPVARQLDLAHLALGAHQPMLPLCSLAAPAELAASVSDRAALTAGDDTAVTAWLQRASLVRPELDPLAGLLTHSEAGGRDVVADLAVGQLPHRPGARWCELPYGSEGPPPAGTVGIVAVAPDGFDPTTAVAGLSVDAWADVIPSTEHTAGLTLHYDAPGARPPQAIVLAVHPDPNPKRWDLNTLIDTVNETSTLAKLRTLTLKETDSFSGLLPALFLPNNYTRDVPSVSLKDLVTVAEANQLSKLFTGIKGK
ncbi:MAG: hypothetical protein QOF47_1664 [Mycobacterium sp.]|nr:hypothetical protein [Mycobacterium sp.]